VGPVLAAVLAITKRRYLFFACLKHRGVKFVMSFAAKNLERSTLRHFNASKNCLMLSCMARSLAIRSRSAPIGESENVA
jgi:hypothetical protein